MSIDSMIPIGRGQRELIIGDRSTGRPPSRSIRSSIRRRSTTSTATKTALSQKISVQFIQSTLPLVEEFDIARTIAVLERAGAMEHTIIAAASAGDNPANQYIAPFSGASMGEFFMNNGMDALIVYDDLSSKRLPIVKFPVLKRPSGREAYLVMFFISIHAFSSVRLVWMRIMVMVHLQRFRLLKLKLVTFRLHSYQCDFDYRRAGLPRNGFV